MMLTPAALGDLQDSAAGASICGVGCERGCATSMLDKGLCTIARKRHVSNSEGGHLVLPGMQATACSCMQATAFAEAECKSHQTGSGKAKGCAWSKSSAKAVGVAFADAVAEASSAAVTKHCSCKKANAFAFGSATILQDLVADVYAEAQAKACVEGNAYAKATAYVDCYADIFADLYAYVRLLPSAIVACCLLDAACQSHLCHSDKGPHKRPGSVQLDGNCIAVAELSIA
jgi:hypothetical protein